MKRILYITNGLSGSGGLERVLSIKTSYLAKHYGYEIHIITLNEIGKKPFYEFENSVQIHSIATRKSSVFYIYDYIKKIKHKIKEINPNAISVCDDGFKAFLFPIIFGKKTPVIYERHISKNVFDNSRFSSVKKKIVNKLANRFNKFVVLTESNKKEWEGVTNIVAIPNPLSFYPNEQSNLESKKVIAVGKVSHQKGFDLLAKAWIKVIEKHPDWQTHIYGKQDDAEDLRKFIKVNNLSDSFILHNPEKNIESKYLESSIYVLSSRYEGFGMVLIEAMACGVPCVAFDCPCGPSDIIRNEEDGFLVETEKVDALAEKIMYLIENEDARKQMGQRARENVKRYLSEKICTQWDNLFTEICAE